MSSMTSRCTWTNIQGHALSKKKPLKMIQLHARRATPGSEKNETFALQNE